nr:7592_t:CDS:2 [Entrophospora candida]
MSSEKKHTEQSSSPPPPFDNNEHNNNNYTNNKIENEESAFNNKSRFNVVEGTRGAFKKDYKTVNVSACNALNGKIDTASVNTFTYDPSVYSTFKVDSHKNLITLKSAITITQSNTTTVTNATVNVRIASTKPEDASINAAPESSDTYVLSIIRSAFDDKWGWTTYLSVPGRCVISQVEVILPQVLSKATAVETDNYDIVVAGHPVPYTTEFRTSTFNGDIYIQDLSASAIKLKSANGDIKSNNLNAASATFESTNGDISVSKLMNLESSLSASTTNGDITMGINIKTAQQPTISATSSNGDVTFDFGSTFSGTYSLSTSNGDVKTSDGTNKKAGSVGKGASNLNVQTTNGDITITF